MTKTFWGSAAMPVAVTLLCLLPFVNKAFHIDDPLFIWTAQQIRKDPLDFYGFPVNWYGVEMPMADVTMNPPGVSYYLALVSGLAGWSEIAVHLALLVPALAVAYGTFRLAQELSAPPALASLATVLTPGFLVSSSNAMSDTSMLALWVWATLFWIRGMRSSRMASLAVAAGLVLLAALTKYFAVALVGLLFALSLYERRRVGRWIWPLAIPVAALAGYQWWTSAHYGHGLLFGAAAYASVQRGNEPGAWFSQGVTALAFAGGGTVTLLFFLPLLWSRRVLAVFAAAVVLLVAGFAWAGSFAGFSTRDAQGIRWGFLSQLGAMTVAGFGLVVLATDDFRRRRDPASLFLLLWVLGTLAFAGYVNWTVNGRSLLPLAPAAGILLARRIRALEAEGAWRPWRHAVPLVCAAIVSLLVSSADYIWGNSARAAAEELHAHLGTRDAVLWFEGHWGFQYYMQRHGYRALDGKRLGIARGDLLVIPTNNTNVRVRNTSDLELVHTVETRPLPWLATMNTRLGAGFYASAWEALPWAVGRVEPDLYYALRVP